MKTYIVTLFGGISNSYVWEQILVEAISPEKAELKAFRYWTEERNIYINEKDKDGRINSVTPTAYIR
jgi:hypothetical protein